MKLMQKKMEMILDMTLENEDVTGNNEYKRNDLEIMDMKLKSQSKMIRKKQFHRTCNLFEMYSCL